mmetsp:Transcript_49651/g.82662  ORF Transcript_49651/g.82662 Transcript_49651/m.82662 type:complete len:413 (-) Transcript_49651:545-1783(-)
MIRGSASIDTGRWANKDVEFQKKINFPTILSTKIDMKKVVFDAIKPWIKQEIDASLGFEDDVVINLVYNLLQTEQFPDGKALAVKLMGFLEADTMSFMQTLWTHLVDANNTKLGISTQLLKDAQQKQKIKKEQKIQKMERFQLKQEIEQKINPFPHRGNGGHSSYPKHDRIKRENQHELKKEHPHQHHHHHHQRHNRHHHRYEPSQRDSFRHPRRSRYHDERSHSPCDNNNPRATSHEQQRDHDHEPRDSMNSVWPPSPSPPAILNEKRNCQTVVKQSPSPPRQIKEEKQDNDRSDRRKSSDIIQPKSILKHSSASARKKRDKRSVPRSISSRSYSRSPSTRSRSRSRSRSSSRSSSLYDRNKSSKGKYERRTRRRHYRNDRRSYSRSADRSRSRSRSRSYSNSSDRGRWKS